MSPTYIFKSVDYSKHKCFITGKDNYILCLMKPIYKTSLKNRQVSNNRTQIISIPTIYLVDLDRFPCRNTP